MLPGERKVSRGASLRTGFVRSGLNKPPENTCHSEVAPTQGSRKATKPVGATEESPSPRAEPSSGHSPETLRDRQIQPSSIQILRSATRTILPPEPVGRTRSCRSPRPWTWRTVLKIAHQVVRTACSCALRKPSRDPHPSPKNFSWPPAAFHLPPVPDAPRRLVPRRRERHASAHYESPSRWSVQRKRHEKTPLTPLTPCEA
jgi:hypothetical protein